MSTDPAAEPSQSASRRTVMRSVVWSTPVILSAVAAPALAASTGPLVVTGGKNLLLVGFQLVLTFSGGDAGKTITITSVSYAFGRNNYNVTMSPTTVASNGGSSYGNLLSSSLLVPLTYTVSYVYAGTSYTTVLVA